MNNSTDRKPIQLLWVIFVMTFPLLSACQKDRLPDEVKTAEDAYRTIFGEWEWEKTIIYNRGQEAPIYQTPDTENKTVEEAFMKNRKSYKVETMDKVSSRTDYTYTVTVDMPGGDGYSGWSFPLSILLLLIIPLRLNLFIQGNNCLKKNDKPLSSANKKIAR